MAKRVIEGIVTSDKGTQTRVVEIPRQVRHPLYGKIIHRRTICYVHDEKEVSRKGDRVEIREAPPRSKLKRWDLVRVVTKGSGVEVVHNTDGNGGES